MATDTHDVAVSCAPGTWWSQWTLWSLFGVLILAGIASVAIAMSTAARGGPTPGQVGGFVAVGAEWTDPYSYPRVWTSSDGVAWSKHTLPGRGSLFGVAAKGNRLVAVGQTTPISLRGTEPMPLATLACRFSMRFPA